MVPPDPRDRRRTKTKPASTSPVRTQPSSDDAHKIVYFRRHPDDDSTEAAPGREFLRKTPAKVRATMQTTLNAVAAAPPKRFSGGGYWEAMHGDMTGWFEVRVDGPRDRTHFRLFCRLDYDAVGEEKPLLVIITGLSKAFRTTLSDADYAGVRTLGDEYFARNPRSWG